MTELMSFAGLPGEAIDAWLSRCLTLRRRAAQLAEEELAQIVAVGPRRVRCVELDRLGIEHHAESEQFVHRIGQHRGGRQVHPLRDRLIVFGDEVVGKRPAAASGGCSERHRAHEHQKHRGYGWGHC